VRLLLGALVPLLPDETYDWDWSRTLQGGYFDHPPMIALLVRAGTALFGDVAFGVRFFPILAGTATMWALVLASRALVGGEAGDHAGRRAALIFACVPIAAAGFVLATPDAPMLCAVSWVLYATVRALQAERGSRASLRWWIVAGLAIGCAMASKYTSVFVPTAIAIGCLLHPRLQSRFAEPGPYVAVIVASLVLAPVLWWNYQHDWVSFRFQLGHGLGTPKGGVLGALNRELEMVGGQIGLLSPILFWFVARSIKRSFIGGEQGIRAVLGTIAVFCLLFFVYSATRRSVEANWPALAWLPGMLLLSTEPLGTLRAERWFGRGLAFGAALIAIIYVHVVHPILPLRADRDQVAKGAGWAELATIIDRRRDMVNSRTSYRVTEVSVAAERYQEASELAFHLPGHPRVYSLNLVGRPNQYDLWSTFPETAQQGAALMVLLDEEVNRPEVIRKLSCCFRVYQGERVAQLRGTELVSQKRLWLLTDWSGEWPSRAQPFPWID
jgi:4-amino-4-deoxy-L-arabinose transferase-like glycosyltransferase